MKFKNISRIRIVSLGVILVALVFIVKLYILQVIQYHDFTILADKQYTRPSNTVFDRGTIFFQNKNGDLISAATLATGFTVAVNPKKITDATSTYQALNAIIPIDHDFFMQKTAQKTQSYIEIAKKVSEENGKKIDDANIPGISVYKDQWRFYPAGQTAAHTLGFVAYKGDDLVGRYGLERFYENVLGRGKTDLYANFFVQIFSNISKTASPTDDPEGNIVATIEPTVQTTLESALTKIQDSWHSDETGGIIMNPKNGEIYAMAAMPTFDPNNFQTQKDVSVFSNPLVEKVYEMGSIIKPITMAAGLDAGVITQNTTYNDTGSVTANNMTIHNHDLIKNGITSMQDVLNDSLNTGAAFVAQKLGQKKFGDYLYAYGLGDKTGIDLPNEAQDLISNVRSKQEIDYITASFGQGIAMTPIATIRALATLANGGVLVTPHVVKKISYNNGLFKTINPPVGPHAISIEASQTLTSMLIKTVDTALLGGAGKNPHYTVAAKTGTAQIAKEGGGGYYTDRYLHSFMGYFPATDPQFVILLYTYDPKTNLFAANTLGQPFFDLSKFLFNYYQIPPDR